MAIYYGEYITVGKNVSITGDLTVTGDDITMGTNTSGYIMIGDGSNFNPVALSGDVSAVSAAGSITIAANAVSLAKMAGLVRGKLIYGDATAISSPINLNSSTANFICCTDCG